MAMTVPRMEFSNSSDWLCSLERTPRHPPGCNLPAGISFAILLDQRPNVYATRGSCERKQQMAECDIPMKLVRFERPLFHLARQLDRSGPVKIVAIGSSSTAGEGDIQ